jgi:hypothetical protein
MASPGHRANLLSDDYTEVGLGVVLGTPNDRALGATYTNDFGERAAASRKASRDRTGARNSRSCTRAASAGRRKPTKSCARVARVRRR